MQRPNFNTQYGKPEHALLRSERREETTIPTPDDHLIWRWRITGFTLIELIIAIAIIAILAAVAVPSYTQYTTRARYTEVVMAAQPYKTGVEQCYQLRRSLQECNGGRYGIPSDQSQVNGRVDTITTQQGVITITPDASGGILSSDTYVLTPSPSSPLIWTSSGGGGWIRGMPVDWGVQPPSPQPSPRGRGGERV